MRTKGTRVEPPTMTTSITSSITSSASFTARRQARNVFFTKGAISCSKSLRVTLPVHVLLSARANETSTLSVFDNCSLAKHACCVSCRSIEVVSGRTKPACAIRCSTNMPSKSSPPSAESPPVANTSNTPLFKRNIEISNVPPPKS